MTREPKSPPCQTWSRAGERRGITRDDFAGPGGWSEGLRILDLREDYAIEFDKMACETARLAGHQRWQVDVTSPEVRNHPWSRRWIWLYIASPPCQTFSMAGNGAGRGHMDALLKAVHLVGEGFKPEVAVDAVSDDALDVRSVLVLEPLYVIRRHMPRNVALEQVTPVLPIWRAYARALREWGYSVWTGYVFSEQYGVPQTRKRAVLMASIDREITGPPTPTHSRYHSHNKAKMDEGVKPWVSMKQALDRPDTLRSNYGSGGDPTARGERTADEPAPTMTTKAGRNQWLQGNQIVAQRRNSGPGAERQPRLIDQPSFTIRAHGSGSHPSGTEWVPEAPNGGDTSWSETRPAPTIVGSFAPDVVAAPGYRKAGDGPRQSQPGSIRVTVQEAGILQSFPPDYPWQGRKGKQFEQVGNAVPPLMAAAILSALLGL